MFEGLLMIEVPQRQQSLQEAEACISHSVQSKTLSIIDDVNINHSSYTCPYVCCCCTMLGAPYDTVAGPPRFSVVAIFRTTLPRPPIQVSAAVQRQITVLPNQHAAKLTAVLNGTDLS